VFADPTIDDHVTQVSLRLDEARERLALETTKIESEFAAKGIYRSTAIGRVLGRVARDEFDKAVAAALGELRRSISETTLDEDELRQVTYDRLNTFAGEMRTYSKLEKLTRTNNLGVPLLAQVVDALPARLAVYLRQFDVGLFGTATPEVLAVTNNNNMNIGTNTGNVQQGTHTSAQSITVALEATTINAALDRFEAALAGLPDDERMKMAPDVVALRAQTTKPTLSEGVIRETGKSLRSVAESVAANLATPDFLAACAALWTVLGIG
jgi:hypothetical protein